MRELLERLLAPIQLGKIREPYTRYFVVGMVVVVVAASAFGQYRIFANILETREAAYQNASEHSLRQSSLEKLAATKTTLNQAKEIGADTAAAELTYAEVKLVVFNNLSPITLAIYKQVVTLFKTAQQLLADRQALLNAEAQLGIADGTVIAGSTPLENVTVSFKGTTEGSAKTDKSGKYHLLITAGSYTATASKSGYNSSSKKITVTAQQTMTLDFSLTVYVAPPPTATNSGSEANGDSSYSLQNVSTGLGVFSAHVATFNLASGQFKVITDTANDADCPADCPTKSLGSYVSTHGAFAGINGTYFCPADYSACASEKNHFFWKVLNYRNGTMINASNGLGENDPFMAFAGNGTARYFSAWSSYSGSGFAAVSGINSKPLLVSGGSNVLNPNSLDEKQRYTKSNRGAIGLNGQTLYLVITKSATVVDLAAVMDALDVTYALNIDGGGSSALIYNNSYKIGPGRGLPNALVVKRN